MSFTRTRHINGRQYLYEEYRWREDGNMQTKSPAARATGLSFRRRQLPSLKVQRTCVAALTPLGVCRRRLWFFVGLGRTQDDLAVYRQRLQHDVEAVAILVRKGRTDVEPIIVLTLTLDDRVRLVGRLLCSHNQFLSLVRISTRRRA